MIAGESRRQSADPTMVPIDAPPPKGEATMTPGESRRGSAKLTMTPTPPPPPKAEATMRSGESRRGSAKLTMTPAPPRQPRSEAKMTPGTSRRGSAKLTMSPAPPRPPKAEAKMTPGTSRRGSAKLTMTPAPPPKSEATMRAGESRRGSAKLTMTPAPPPPKSEATMRAGESRRRSADPTMKPIQAPAAKGDATMVSGGNQAPSADPTLVPIIGASVKGDATMIPGGYRRASADPTMLPGESRRRSAEPTMLPTPAPAAKGDATMAPTPVSPPPTPKTEATKLPGQNRHPLAPSLKKTAELSDAPMPDSRSFLEAAVEAFIAEIRSLATAQKMEYSIIQPDDLKFDFFNDSKALRVVFTGRGDAVDRIVIRELSSSANTKVHYVGGKGARSLFGANSARRQTLELESGKKDFGLRDSLLNVATIRDAEKNDLDWNQPNVLEECKTPTPESQVVIEAFYFDADSKRNWAIELVNSAPASADETAKNTSGRDLTPESARRLVTVLLKSMREIAGHQSSILTFPVGI